MKEALDRAATSADQAVRSMAIRYREMQQEFTQYEAFFAIYKQGVKINGTATVVAKPTVPRGRTPGSRTSIPRANRVDVFGTAMRDILLAHGQPMKLSDVFAAYQEKYPEDKTSSETFRQRLVKRPGLLTSIKGYGWWLVDVPLTETAELAETAESV